MDLFRRQVPLTIIVGIACAVYGGQSTAATIVKPDTASATTTFISSIGNDYSILHTFNQSGLSAGYDSGVTNFDTYLADNPTHTSVANGAEWFSQNYGISGITSLSVTYAFNTPISIDGFALWNEEYAGIGTANLLWSIDNIAYEFLRTITPVPSEFSTNRTPVSYSAQTFSFVPTTMQYFRLEITNCPGRPSAGFTGCGIGEVAFSSLPPSSTPAVPVPAALPLLGSALGIFAWLGRRQKKSSGTPS